ncbi:unnamed protein product [Durusdinium trenchii]|uniref:RNA helicase n=1 Tax=Durusdinium trenchii TaxID=1381693 RepID=A0ABP0SRR6_9DINO
MNAKRKRSAQETPQEAVLEGERFHGYIHHVIGDKMFVTCDGVPPEFESRPPKITKKSQAPPGLVVGSWISFDLVDEWPGENWGSPLAVNIEAEDTPEGFTLPVKAVKAPNGAGPRSSMAAAAEKLRAAAARQRTAAPPANARSAANLPKKTLPGRKPVSEATEGGLAKSGAVAAFRQAKEEGRSFESGWKTSSAPAKTLSSAWRTPKAPRTMKAKTAELPPFQRKFLEEPEELDEEYVQGMQEQRLALDVSVEIPAQLQDVFPPIDSFEDLQGMLPDYAFKGLSNMGIEVPTPIQAQALPLVLSGSDVVGVAKTGSGKTLAYVLPAIAHVEVQEPKPKGDATPIVLILAPTRELAVQISDMVKAVTYFSKNGSAHPGGLTPAVLYGGGQGSKGWQVAECRNGGHFVAATPGRLLDVIDSGEVSLERVTFFVLDEADRMLECGFEEQVGRIGQTVRPDRHTLFFSATWPSQVQKMAQRMCSSEIPPVRIMAGQRTDGEGPTSREDILQEVVVFEQPTWEERDSAKQELLYAHLREVLSDASHKMLVFVSRKNLADTLAKRLKSEGFSANVMHGGKSQDSRLATLEEFRNGDTKLLVTTDVMGRGLDIPGISHVVIYDMGDIEDYVHRIGRTARGPYGRGHALTFYEHNRKLPDLPRKLMDVLEQSGQEVPPELAAMVEGGGLPKTKATGWRSWM